MTNVVSIEGGRGATNTMQSRLSGGLDGSLPQARQTSYGGGGGGSGEMDIRERMTAIEKAQIQSGMDMSYVRGRIEDMPTKDWFNMRLTALFGGLAVFITLALAVFGAFN